MVAGKNGKVDMTRLVALVVAFLMAAPAALRAAPVPALDLLDARVAYRAEFYLKSDGRSYSGHVWHAPGRDRHDVTGGQAVILRRDTNQAFVLVPARKFYTGFTFQGMAGLVGGDALMVERRKVDDETYEGHPVTRWEATASSPTGGRFEGDVWTTKEGIVVRMVGTVRFGERDIDIDTGLKNLKIGKVDDHLFELPADYQGFDVDALKNSLRKLQGK